MLGIIIQLAISWALVWFFDRNNLRVLGLYPTRHRIMYFALFFIITSLCCSSEFLMKIFIARQKWQLNTQLTINTVFEGIWWNIKSVLFEELIFRGAILYILIKKFGSRKAIIISAIAFGIYHWFSQNAFGNVVQMVIIFLATGIMGLLLAYAYSRSFSLFIPIAIHLGWNFTRIFVFSGGPIGNGIFIPAVPGPFRTDSYFIFFCIIFLPLISTIVINYFLLKQYRQVSPTILSDH